MRLPDWETRLAAHFAAIHARTFAWGYFDCALAVCDGIEAVTGENPGSAYRENISAPPKPTSWWGLTWDDLPPAWPRNLSFRIGLNPPLPGAATLCWSTTEIRATAWPRWT